MEYALLDDEVADDAKQVDSYFGRTVCEESASAANPLVKTIVPPDAFGDPLFVKKKEAPFIRETQTSALFRMPKFSVVRGKNFTLCFVTLHITLRISS